MSFRDAFSRLTGRAGSRLPVKYGDSRTDDEILTQSPLALAVIDAHTQQTETTRRTMIERKEALLAEQLARVEAYRRETTEREDRMGLLHAELIRLAHEQAMAAVAYDTVRAANDLAIARCDHVLDQTEPAAIGSFCEELGRLARRASEQFRAIPSNEELIEIRRGTLDSLSIPAQHFSNAGPVDRLIAAVHAAQQQARALRFTIATAEDVNTALAALRATVPPFASIDELEEIA